MPKKKPTRAKKAARKPKATPKKTTAKKKVTRSKKAVRAKKVARRKEPAGRRTRGRREGTTIAAVEEQGLGSESAGQSGDVQGLSHYAGADSESVEELAEEGQAFEAEVISGVENAPDPDEAEVTTREVPEDDVPPEYRETE